MAEPTSERVGRDVPLVHRLRAGDLAAFNEIVQAWSPAMLRLARMYVSTDASAQDVVQETWLAVVHGLAGFEERSSVRTWAFRILMNRAKTRAQQERRTLPWSDLEPAEATAPTVDPTRFRGPGDRWPGHWTEAGTPRRWHPSPEDAAMAGEIRARLTAALALLPARQRAVVSLRDVHGLEAGEVCEMLGVSAANQRVLLHRGRAKLRETLADYYHGEPGVVRA